LIYTEHIIENRGIATVAHHRAPHAGRDHLTAAIVPELLNAIATI
jgi:hypothetical protein